MGTVPEQEMEDSKGPLWQLDTPFPLQPLPQADAVCQLLLTFISLQNRVTVNV